jgi:hypothetical protein
VEAKRDSRTLTNLIEVALKRHLARAHVERSGSALVPDTAREPEDIDTPAASASPRRL